MDCLVERLTLTDSFGVVRLAALSFVAAAGQLTAIVGPPGSGKSALLRTVAGLPQPGEAVTGTVRYAGQSLTGREVPGGPAAGIRWVGPDRSVEPRRTVRDNLVAVARAALNRQVGASVGPADRPQSGRASDREVARWLDQLLGYFPRLAPRLDAAAGNLSQGEQQILSLALQVATRPRLLAVDRASAGVSPLSLPEIFRGLRQYAREQHAVVICAEENTPALLREADLIVILERGTLIFSGSLDELKANPESLARLGLVTPRPHYGRRDRTRPR